MGLGEGKGGRGARSNVGSRDAIDGHEMAGLQRRVEDRRGRIRRRASVEAKMEHAGAGNGRGCGRMHERARKHVSGHQTRRTSIRGLSAEL